MWSEPVDRGSSEALRLERRERRRYVEDMRVRSQFQEWQAEFTHQECATDIHLRDQVVSLHWRVFSISYKQSRGVVNEDVDAAPLFYYFLDGAGDLVRILEIAGDWECLATCFFNSLGCGVNSAREARVGLHSFSEDGDLGSIFGEAKAHGETEPPRGPSDDYDLIFERASGLEFMGREVLVEKNGVRPPVRAERLHYCFQSLHYKNQSIIREKSTPLVRLRRLRPLGRLKANRAIVACPSADGANAEVPEAAADPKP